MHYVYLARYNKEKMYVGQTNDLKRRLAEHRHQHQDFDIIYCEIYKSKKDALIREITLKQFGNAYKQLKRRLKHSINL